MGGWWEVDLWSLCPTAESTELADVIWFLCWWHHSYSCKGMSTHDSPSTLDFYRFLQLGLFDGRQQAWQIIVFWRCTWLFPNESARAYECGLSRQGFWSVGARITIGTSCGTIVAMDHVLCAPGVVVKLKRCSDLDGLQLVLNWQ